MVNEYQIFQETVGVKRDIVVICGSYGVANVNILLLKWSEITIRLILVFQNIIRIFMFGVIFEKPDIRIIRPVQNAFKCLMHTLAAFEIAENVIGTGVRVDCAYIASSCGNYPGCSIFSLEQDTGSVLGLCRQILEMVVTISCGKENGVRSLSFPEKNCTPVPLRRVVLLWKL